MAAHELWLVIMRKSSVVLSDEEIAAQIREAAPAIEGAGATEKRVTEILEERAAHRMEVQQSYDKDRGNSAGAIRPSPQTIYPVQENTGQITAMYDPNK